MESRRVHGLDGQRLSVCFCRERVGHVHVLASLQTAAISTQAKTTMHAQNEFQSAFPLISSEQVEPPPPPPRAASAFDR